MKANTLISMKFAAASAAAVLGGSLFAACGGTSSASPVGTYVRPHIAQNFTNKLAISADGTYTQSFTGVAGQPVQGKWTSQSNMIDFTETGGAGSACAGQTGIYKWSLNGTQFTLTPVNDPCQNRMGDFQVAFTKT